MNPRDLANRPFFALSLLFVTLLPLVCFTEGRALAQGVYSCEMLPYRDHAESTGFWVVREETGTHLNVHVGTSKQGVLGDRYDEVYSKVHGRSPRGLGRWTRTQGDWQAAIKYAEDACREWKQKGQPIQVDLPPVESARPPVLAEMVLEQRHLTRERAQLRISARAEYEAIGAFRRGEVLWTVRIRNRSGQLVLTEKYCPLSSPEVRRDGDTLFLTLLHELSETGEYTVRVTLLDSRFSSGAHSRVSYEDSLRAPITVHQPVAEIVQATGSVSVKRVDPKTAAGGVRVQAGSRIVLTDATDRLQAGPAPVGDWRADPYAQDSGIAGNRFLYEGDEVHLWGHADRSVFNPAEQRVEYDPRADMQERKAYLGSGMSSIELTWPGGASGKAIWQPAISRYTTYGKFIVGATREASGKWRDTWQDAMSGGVQFLFEQGIDFVRDKGLLWYLNLNVGALSSFVTAFNLTAGGGEEWDELIYVRLNSEVVIRSGKGDFELFTLAGSPEILRSNSGKRVVVEEGRMVRLTPALVSPPRAFEPRELLPAESPAAAGVVPIDLDLAADIVSGLAPQREADIPSLQARVTGVAFYEGGIAEVPMKERVYGSEFPAASTRCIWWELNIAYPDPGRRIDFQVESFLYRPDGTVLNHRLQDYFIEPSWTSSSHYMGFGWEAPGTWQPGVYRLEMLVAGKKVAIRSFEITREKEAHDGSTTPETP